MRRGTYRQVEQIFVLCTTSVTYSEKIILFMIWMFDQRREFLVQEYIHEFEAMNHEDLLGFQQHKEDEHVTKIRKINQINQRTGIQRLDCITEKLCWPRRSSDLVASKVRCVYITVFALKIQY